MLPPASTAEVFACLERIIASEGFVRSGAICQLLQYAVKQALNGNTDALKEYTLGVDVFQRGSGFDSRVDPIVRVQARRMRDRLAAYYETEGRDDPVRIEFPKGSYVPVFVPQTVAETAEGAEQPEEPERPVARRDWSLRQTVPRRLRESAGFVVAVTVIAFACGTWFGDSLARGHASTRDLNSLVIAPVEDMVNTPESLALAKALTSELKLSLPKIGATGPAVLTGYVKSFDSQLTVQLHLTRGRHKKPLWSGMYVRSEGAAQSIAKEIAGAASDRVAEVADDDEESVPAFPGDDFSPKSGFDPSKNPSGSWSFGWRNSLAGELTLYTKHFDANWWGKTISGWSRNGEGPQNGNKCCPYAGTNVSQQTIRSNGLRVPPGWFSFHPGPNGEFSVVRWTVPSTARYSIQARFGSLASPVADIHILKNGHPLMDAALDGMWATYDYSLPGITCYAGEIVEFVVGYGDDHSLNGDITGLAVRVKSVP